MAGVGNESTIDDYPHAGWGNHDCGHYKDAGVRCRGNQLHLLCKLKF